MTTRLVDFFVANLIETAFSLDLYEQLYSVKRTNL